MGKQVKEVVALGYRLNDTDVCVFRAIAELCNGDPGLSNVELSKMLNICKGTVRASVHRLNEYGLLRTSAQFLRNGGQIENKHEITVKGALLLLSLQDAPK